VGALYWPATLPTCRWDMTLPGSLLAACPVAGAVALCTLLGAKVPLPTCWDGCAVRCTADTTSNVGDSGTPAATSPPDRTGAAPAQGATALPCLSEAAPDAVDALPGTVRRLSLLRFAAPSTFSSGVMHACEGCALCGAVASGAVLWSTALELTARAARGTGSCALPVALATRPCHELSAILCALHAVCRVAFAAC
jgi:hypothetical protein